MSTQRINLHKQTLCSTQTCHAQALSICTGPTPCPCIFVVAAQKTLAALCCSQSTWCVSLRCRFQALGCCDAGCSGQPACSCVWPPTLKLASSPWSVRPWASCALCIHMSHRNDFVGLLRCIRDSKQTVQAGGCHKTHLRKPLHVNCGCACTGFDSGKT
jgi:hypothetical protein